MPVPSRNRKAGAMSAILLAGLFYVDIGIGLHLPSDDIRLQRADGRIQRWNNPIGTIEAGYRAGRLTLYLSHQSSTEQRDQGLNKAGVKYRLIEW